MTLRCPPSEEIIIQEHLEIFAANGFHIQYCDDAPAGTRLKLCSLPFSKNTVFTVDDVHELASMIGSQYGGSGSCGSGGGADGGGDGGYMSLNGRGKASSSSSSSGVNVSKLIHLNTPLAAPLSTSSSSFKVKTLSLASASTSDVPTSLAFDAITADAGSDEFIIVDDNDDNNGMKSTTEKLDTNNDEGAPPMEIDELANPVGGPMQSQASLLRLPKLLAMFASRACRSAVMVGTALRPHDMRSIVNQLGGLVQPWNCPHGRPTMRHLVDLSSVLASRQQTLIGGSN